MAAAVCFCCPPVAMKSVKKAALNVFNELKGVNWKHLTCAWRSHSEQLHNLPGKTCIGWAAREPDRTPRRWDPEESTVWHNTQTHCKHISLFRKTHATQCGSRWYEGAQGEIIQAFTSHLVSRKNMIPWWAAEAALPDMISEQSWTTKRTNQKTLKSTGTANWFHREIPTARSLYSSITCRAGNQDTYVVTGDQK